MRKIVIAGMAGNALEWYDYSLYGHFAAIISSLFFPSYDAYTSLMMTFGIFAAGFIMRPIGAIIFGYIGDKFGRKISLAIAIITMAIPTALIGILPGYDVIGIAAPILLTFIRLLQGLSLGGAASGCISFLIEHAPKHRKGLAGSAAMLSMCIGILFGSLVSSIMSGILTEEQLHHWGWRVPFLISFPMSFIGFYINKYLEESPQYMQQKALNNINEAPAILLIKKYLPNLTVAIGIYLTVIVTFYILTVFNNNYVTKVLNFTINQSLHVNIIGTLSLMIFLTPAAWLSDKYGRKIILFIGLFLFLLLTYPAFNLINSNDYYKVLTGQAILGFLVAVYIGPMGAALAELFPTSVRFTGVALAYNISAAAFGGTTPMIATWLTKLNNDNKYVALYVMAFIIISLISMFFFKDKYLANKSK